MREIKFRAWVKPLKKMALVYTLGLTGIEGTTVNVDGALRSGLDRTTMELMQFTGLKDKNGKEIYEGDIVRNLHYKSIAQVVWKECEPSTAGIVKGLFGEESDLTGYISNLGEFKLVGIGGTTKAFYINEFEVIGNIYENEKLLTTKSK